MQLSLIHPLDHRGSRGFQVLAGIEDFDEIHKESRVHEARLNIHYVLE